MSNVWFGNVTAKSEGGFLFSGDPESNIDGITVKDTSLTLTQLTKVAGSYRDFRPSQAGLVNASAVPAILLENANHVQLSNIEVGHARIASWLRLIQKPDDHSCGYL